MSDAAPRALPLSAIQVGVVGPLERRVVVVVVVVVVAVVVVVVVVAAV